MTETIRVGIIGTGWFADFYYLPILQNHPNAEITAICGRNQDRGQELSAKYGISKYYPDYRQMIDSGDLDAVIVYVPDDLHYPMTMAALDAHLHVICEKPMAIGVTQAREMYDKGEEVGVKHMLNFTNRGLPYFRYIKRLLEEEYLGTPYHAHFEWLTGWAANPEYQWYFDPNRSQGTLSGLGSHTIDLARWYLGEVTRVSARLGNYVNRLGADGAEMESENDAAFLLMDFANGLQATVHLSMAYRISEGLKRTGEIILLHGRGGTLELQTNAWAEPPFGEIIGYQVGLENAETLAVPQEYFGAKDRSSFFGAFHSQSVGPRLFIDAIVNDSPITPSFYDGFKAQQIIDAAFESDKTGCAIIIDHSM